MPDCVGEDMRAQTSLVLPCLRKFYLSLFAAIIEMLQEPP
jgi:hypothetical protein